MKVTDVIDQMSLIKNKFGPDAEVSIRNASIKVDGINVSRIYCEELLPMLVRCSGDKIRSIEIAEARREEIVRMYDGGMTFKAIGAGMNVSAGRIREIYKTYHRKFKREQWVITCNLT